MMTAERLTVAFLADSPADAVAAAKAWVAAEPALRLRTICSVRRDPANQRSWIVELAVNEKPGTRP